MNEKIEALKKIIAYEEKKIEEYQKNPLYEGLSPKPWWNWKEIGIGWKIIQELLLKGYLKTLGRNYYLLKDRERIKKEIEEIEKMEEIEKNYRCEPPPDLFDIIEGYEDLKKFILLSLKANEPVHVLLVGPPATGKSLILQEIERLGGYYVTMGTTSKVGLRDIIYEETPRYLIIDEIDKLNNRKDIASLLTWMESGKIIITIHGKKVIKQGKGWVFASANTLHGLPQELIDRFQVFYLKPYSQEQFKRVVIKYLVKRMKKDEEIAEYIANKVLSYSNSVREAIRIARLANSKEEVDEVLKIINAYKIK